MIELRQPLVDISQDISKATGCASKGLKASLLAVSSGPPGEDNHILALEALGISEEVIDPEGVFDCRRGYAQGWTRVNPLSTRNDDNLKYPVGVP